MDEKNKNKFSVLISLYEKEKPIYLKQCIDSILTQTILPNEIVIVKDGKLNDDLEMVISESMKKHTSLFKIISFTENKGLGIALREGLKHCSYDIVARMDTDDICKSYRFEKQLNILNDNQDICIVGSYIDEFNDDINEIISTRKVPVNNLDIYKFIKRRNPFNHMTVMFRKQSIIDVGSYKDFKGNEDYYLWARLINSGYKGYNIPESLVYARVGNNMIDRRRGIALAIQDIKLQIKFLNMGLINVIEFLSNLLTRPIIRLLPNKILKDIYKYILR